MEIALMLVVGVLICVVILGLALGCARLAEVLGRRKTIRAEMRNVDAKYRELIRALR